MTRQHGQTFYFIEGEGFVGEEEIRAGLRPFSAGIRAATAPSVTLDPERAFRFSRMFPMLPSFRPDPAALIQLGQAMEETANFTDHPDLPAGFTYFGQFLDHDITFDKTEGMPDAELSPEEIIQGRSPSLDLDSVYGRGPELEEKHLYEADKVRLQIGPTVAVGAPNEPEGLILSKDLPR